MTTAVNGYDHAYAWSRAVKKLKVLYKNILKNVFSKDYFIFSKYF